jgi:hypothetical protein
MLVGFVGRATVTMASANSVMNFPIGLRYHRLGPNDFRSPVAASRDRRRSFGRLKEQLGNGSDDLRRRATDFDYRCEANYLTATASRRSIP